MNITFRLNGETIALRGANPTTTLLDWLREERGLTGTKEGCNEGDCGACSVMVTDEQGAHALNACILFLPQLDGKAVRTVEGIAAPDGTLHPVQREMIDKNGSQCGFCTPGFIVSMATAHLNCARDYDDQLAGNLCRCTGYAPIVRAAEAAEKYDVPIHLHDSLPEPAVSERDDAAFMPRTSDELAEWYAAHPDATLIAGATDVGLWVTKQLRDLSPVAFLHKCSDLKGVQVDGDQITIGAMTSLKDLRQAIAPYYLSFAELIRRYGSEQVRNAATIGGNIANGSPIGDGPPALIALGATLHLRFGQKRRSMPLDAFFLEYGKQDRSPGEFVEKITLDAGQDNLRCYKLSKRFDQDISAVCGCFNVERSGDIISGARIAFGGMAGIPQRAAKTEAVLMGAKWSEETIQRAMEVLREEFSPLTDMRASAAYRQETATNMLQRYWLDMQGQASSVFEVTA